VPPSATYTFKHALIQDAAYESLLRKTRQEFHGKIAQVLVGRFPEMAETKPELLARHYEGAGRIEEATAGWMKAGVQASNRSALRESVAYLRKAIALLETLPPDDPKRLKSEMEAQLALAPSLMSSLGWGSPEAEAACLRARDLCAVLGNPQGLLGSLWGLWTVYLLRGTHSAALETAQSVLEMAQGTEDPILHVVARHAIGYSTYFLGDFVAAREHAEKGLALYNRERERALVGVFQIPSSFACGSFQTMSLWFLGYPEQAEAARQNAWRKIEDLAIPACTAYGLGCALMIHYARRDVATVASYANEVYRISREDGYLIWAAHGRVYRGWAQAMNGDAEAGIAEIHGGMEDYRLTGSELMVPQMCLMLAEALWRAKRPGEALAALSRGMKMATEHQERAHEPELHRLKGEIQFAQGAGAAGEASLRRAIALAQAQGAKMLELRAALSLAKVLAKSGRGDEGRALLRPVCEWFTEGWESPELVEARAAISGS
jgi:predicted ATPase